jgi:hypothetical protein
MAALDRIDMKCKKRKSAAETGQTVIRAYKMTDDVGFAPNPGYGGGDYLTLATCKPGIRRCHSIGDWLAGFTSQKLNGDCPGQERLIYLAKVSNSIPISEYYEDYPKRRIDNIYEWKNNKYYQLANKYHTEEDMERDISGLNVLIAEEYYYFGGDALDIPNDLRIKLPNRSTYGFIVKGKAADDFIAWVRQKAGGRTGRLGNPAGVKKKECLLS